MTGRSSKSYKHRSGIGYMIIPLAEPRFYSSRDSDRVTQAAIALAAFVAAFCN
jgi:hypothetical protein